MSEIGWYKSRIRLAKVRAYASNIEANPSFQILKRSLGIVAQEHDGTITDQVTDAAGRKTTCDLAIKTQRFPRGVGIEINDKTGEVTFLYDQYGGQEQLASEISEEITQNYVSIGLIRAMKSLGYTVEEETPEQQATVALVGRI